MDFKILKDLFVKENGIVTTEQLKDIGLNKWYIKKLVVDNVIARIKLGFYEYLDMVILDEAYLVKLFPEAVICMESALNFYGYSDRIPLEMQVAVPREYDRNKYKIDYPKINPRYTKREIWELGIAKEKINEIEVKIYNREKTICDCLKNMNKMDSEIFRTAIRRYIADNKKDISRLTEYAKKMKLTKKISDYVGVWL